MRMRFVGKYTGGRTSITVFGTTFEGHEPRTVKADVAAKLAQNIEFEAVTTRAKGRTDGDV